jgi:hypothetical protein
VVFDINQIGWKILEGSSSDIREYFTHKLEKQVLEYKKESPIIITHPSSLLSFMCPHLWLKKDEYISQRRNHVKKESLQLNLYNEIHKLISLVELCVLYFLTPLKFIALGF